MSRCEIRSTVKVSKRESESENSKQRLHNEQMLGRKGGKRQYWPPNIRPNGPKMPIFGQKCQFWAKFGRFWAKNPSLWGAGSKNFGTLVSGIQ